MLPKHYIITGGRIYVDGNFLDNMAVEVKGNLIQSVKLLETYSKTLPRINMDKADTLIPGFIDLHIHGSCGYDVMDASKESLVAISQSMLKQGVCGFLATTMTASEAMIANAVSTIGYAYQEGIVPNLLGIHLEGPFINPTYMGAQPEKYIQKADYAAFDKWQRLSGGLIRQVTIAPEIEGAIEVIDKLSRENIILSAGHSAAKCCLAQRAFSRGITHATHLYNAMSGLDKRQPGLAMAVLLDDKVSAELIVDGVHLSPEIIKLTVKLLGKERVILITDAMSAQGAGEGRFQLGGQTVTVKGNQARLDNGVLAGSILTMNQALKNCYHLAEITLEDAVLMSTFNPAKKLGIEECYGQIKAGCYACFSVLDEHLTIKDTWFMGQLGA
ncbi:N-acetylglucosamine-6-phosphate deacetylase [Thiotrichales bacterium 19S3-7]|nr:N-acetylglucosamine-6-phosphate deacetylase [Thiotrichales bacterium 19S3-7]MCF6801580.1 N-acetylglucosamine-6-phosphate deacetylase [Thiotrichales bacterium 19S3-11]